MRGRQRRRGYSGRCLPVLPSVRGPDKPAAAAAAVEAAAAAVEIAGAVQKIAAAGVAALADVAVGGGGVGAGVLRGWSLA